MDSYTWCPMQFRPLGQTGLDVSILSFGASSLGGVFRPTDDAESMRTVHTALDLGINFIDVSPYYGEKRKVLAEIVTYQVYIDDFHSPCPVDENIAGSTRPRLDRTSIHTA